MSPNPTSPPVKSIAWIALSAGLLLLIAPWTPPQAALFVMVSLFVLGVTVYFGVSYAITELHHGWEAAEPEVDENEAKLEELNGMYERGEIGEDELEERVERVYSGQVGDNRD